MRKKLLIPLLVLCVAACASTPPGKTLRRAPRAEAKNMYVAGRGETLESVAKKFDISVAALKKANNLSRDEVTEGQRLTIPAAQSGSFLPPNGKGEEPVAGKMRSRPRVKALAPSGPAPRIAENLVWPVSGGSVSSGFGIRRNGKHDGIDITAREGTKIGAASAGTVIFSGWGPSGYGFIVVIKHSEELVTVYAHNQKNLVERGQAVTQGQPIALVGHSGRAEASHCHFEVRVSRVAYDPMEYLK
ncbi:MAG: LysM peptidoglycan-binding domain-containing M23 family metallopeptidase [Nitrospinae bacterium]|nr:LysM peptidoglycan-binding domain-containing M23 family metallopeptidase [Nitrospinota bacterium]